MRGRINLNDKKSFNNEKFVLAKNVSENVYICGAANSGKTTLFNGLTGASERTGNWYGVTTDVKAGVLRLKNALVQIYDLPGSYFDDYTLEGKRTLNKIKNARGVIIVLCEAANLQQGLKLYKKAREYSAGKAALVINMYSELKKRGGSINLAELKKTIGNGVIIAEVNGKAGVLAVKKLVTELLFSNESDKNNKTDKLDKSGESNEETLLLDEGELLNRVLKPPKSELYGIDKRMFASPISSSIILIAAFFVGAYIAFGEFGLGKALCFLTEKNNLLYRRVSDSLFAHKIRCERVFNCIYLRRSYKIRMFSYNVFAPSFNFANFYFLRRTKRDFSARGVFIRRAFFSGRAKR